jgi:hypothetical protein
MADPSGRIVVPLVSRLNIARMMSVMSGLAGKAVKCDELIL